MSLLYNGDIGTVDDVDPNAGEIAVSFDGRSVKYRPQPSQDVGELHDRMPVILAETDWPKWLGEEPAREQELLALLRPCQDEVLKIGRSTKWLAT